MTLSCFSVDTAAQWCIDLENSVATKGSHLYCMSRWQLWRHLVTSRHQSQDPRRTKGPAELKWRRITIKGSRLSTTVILQSCLCLEIWNKNSHLLFFFQYSNKLMSLKSLRSLFLILGQRSCNYTCWCVILPPGNSLLHTYSAPGKCNMCKLVNGFKWSDPLISNVYWVKAVADFDSHSNVHFTFLALHLTMTDFISDCVCASKQWCTTIVRSQGKTNDL